MSIRPVHSELRADRRYSAAVVGSLCLLVTGFVLVFELDPGHPPPRMFGDPPWGRHTWDGVAGIVSAATALCLLGYGILRRWPVVRKPGCQRLLKLVLALLVLVGGFSELYGRKISRPSFVHRYDTYHYALGPKYYDELGYFRHYECTVAALSQRAIPDARKIRDLRTYLMTTAGEIRENNDCERRFSSRRWAQWRDDVEMMRTGFGSAAYFKGALSDHGYNGTPFHALVAGRIMHSFEVSHRSMNLAALIDLLGLGALLFAVARAFGWRTGLIFAVFFLTNVVDRNAVMGASIFRVFWMVSLGVGIACLRGKRYGWAAAALVTAAMLNVFPLLFIIGPAARAVAELIRTRTLAARYRRFLGSAAVTTLLLGSASVAHAEGVGNYGSFFDNMQVHRAGPPVDDEGTHQEPMPGFGVGLKFPFLYRGQHSRSDKFSAKQKSEDLREIRPLITGIGIALSTLSVFIAVRLDDTEASILVGFTVFFCLLGTVGYYFACASLLVLLLYRHLAEPGGLLLLVVFFIFNSIGHLVLYETRANAVLHNTVMSSLWLIYLGMLLVYFALETGLLRDAGKTLAAPASD